MKLDDYRPTQAETEMTEGMSDQVALGYIRAKCKDDLQRCGQTFHSDVPIS